MLKKILISTTLFFVILPLTTFLIKKNGYYFPKIMFEEFNLENQVRFQYIKGNFYYYKKKIKLEEGYLYSFAYKPVGYILFKKTGSEINFFLPENNQIFWTKEAHYYPYLEPYGNFILGINSDRTKIEILDINGNLLQSIEGSFLVDFKCFEVPEPQCIFLFNNGKIVFFSKSIFKEIYLKENKVFYKSFTVQNNIITFHYYKNSKDFFTTYEIVKKEKEITLKKQKEIISNFIFPYTITFCKLEDNIVFSNFNQIIKIQENTKKVKLDPIIEETINSQEQVEILTNFLGNSIYLENLCIVFNENFLSFWNKNGNLLFYYKLHSKKVDFFYDKNLYIFLDNSYISLSFFNFIH